MSTDPDTDQTDPDTTRNDTDQTDPDTTRNDTDQTDHEAIELRSVVVEYDHRPDRRTVYPEGLSSVERMATWLSADDDAFVDLDALR